MTLKHYTLKVIPALLMLAFVTLFSSCEKEVHINLQSSEPRVVVQGEIETGFVPFVVLTSSLGFFSKVDLTTFQNSFLHDAKVQVSDGTTTVDLKEYSMDTSGAAKFYFYSVDTSNLSNIIVGQNGKTYTLTVTYKGKVYTAATKIPMPQGIDTMWFDKPEFAGPKTPDSARQLFINYSDPDTLGDYVRYFTQRGNQAFFPAGSFSDEVINGKTITNIGLAAGYQDDGGDGNRDSLVYFFPGEEVTLKWCAVDKGVYQFWNSLDFAKGAVGNPFATPINPLTNMSNGALGVWAGYGVYYKTATVPHQ